MTRFNIVILRVLLLVIPLVFSSPLTSRDDNENWATAIRKGTLLQRQLESGCFPDTNNPITLPQLEKIGFQIGHDVSSRWPPKFSVLRVFENLVMERMGWSEGMDYWTSDCQRGFSTPTPSRTDYFNSFSPHNGLIAALENRKSPSETIFWSDLAFALWSAITTYTQTPIRNLRYIARHEIDNPITKSIIDRAVGPRPKPVVNFDRGTKGFTALLGTPNGAGVVFLLMQHKRQLGVKRIERAVVFPNRGVFPDVVFVLGDLDVVGEGVAGLCPSVPLNNSMEGAYETS